MKKKILITIWAIIAVGGVAFLIWMKCPLTEEEVYQPVNEVEAQTGEKLTNNIEELTEDFEKSIEKKELTHTWFTLLQADNAIWLNITVERSTENNMSPFVTSLENLELSDLQVPIDDTQLDIQKIGELSSEQIQKAIWVLQKLDENSSILDWFGIKQNYEEPFDEIQYPSIDFLKHTIYYNISLPQEWISLIIGSEDRINNSRVDEINKALSKNNWSIDYPLNYSPIDIHIGESITVIPYEWLSRSYETKDLPLFFLTTGTTLSLKKYVIPDGIVFESIYKEIILNKLRHYLAGSYSLIAGSLEATSRYFQKDGNNIKQIDHRKNHDGGRYSTLWDQDTSQLLRRTFPFGYNSNILLDQNDMSVKAIGSFADEIFFWSKNNPNVFYGLDNRNFNNYSYNYDSGLIWIDFNNKDWTSTFLNNLNI